MNVARILIQGGNNVSSLGESVPWVEISDGLRTSTSSFSPMITCSADSETANCLLLGRGAGSCPYERLRNSLGCRTVSKCNEHHFRRITIFQRAIPSALQRSLGHSAWYVRRQIVQTRILRASCGGALFAPILQVG